MAESDHLDESLDYREASLSEVDGGTSNILKIGRQQKSGGEENSTNVTVTMHGGSAETVSAIGILQGNLFVSGDSQLKLLRDKTVREINRWTHEMVELSSVQRVVQMVKDKKRFITITGCPGEGKTTVGYMALEQLKDKHKVFKVDTPEDYFHIVRSVPNSVILMNDVLGAFAFDPSALARWEAVFNHFWDRKSLAKGHHTAILFVSRSNVVQGAKSHFENFKDKMFTTECMVDLSSSHSSSKTEKERILYLHLGTVTISTSVVDSLCSGLCPHGFAHCCKIYSEILKSGNMRVDIVSFFGNPLKFLAQTTAALVAREKYETLLKEMLRGNGRLDLEQVECDKARSTMKTVSDELRGSYLNIDGYTMEFAHPSIYESVAFCIGKKDPLFAVRNFKTTFLLQKVVISADASHLDDCLVIEPTSNVIKEFSHRFVPDIRNKDFSILNHEVCKREDVCKELLISAVERKSVLRSFQRFFPGMDSSKQDVNSKDENEDTLLHVAAKAKNRTAMDILLTIGADINVRDGTLFSRGDSFFHDICLQENMTDLAIRLIQDGAYVNEPFSDGDPVFQYMFRTGRFDIATMLLEHGANVDQTDAAGKTALHYSCMEPNRPERIQFLVDHGASVNKRKTYKANIREKVFDEDEELGDIFVNVASGLWRSTQRKGKTAIHYVCREHREISYLKILLKHGADVNAEDRSGRTALNYLSRGEQDISEAIELLIQHGGKVNSSQNDDEPVFRDVLLKGRFDVASMLLQNGANVDQTDAKGKTALHYSCMEAGRPERVKFLVDHGASVNKRRTYKANNGKQVSDEDEDDNEGLGEIFANVAFELWRSTYRKGKAAIHYICRDHGEVSYLEILLKNGADVNAKDGDGRTALHYLYGNVKQNFAAMKLLLQHGADIQTVDDEGLTLLHRECIKESPDIALLTYILEKGGDVNKRKQYNAKVVLETWDEDERFVTSLVAGIGKTAFGKGKTPLHYICRNEKADEQIIQLFLDHGASVNTEDNYKMLPLQYAVMNSAIGLSGLWLLISYGSDCRKVTSDGDSLLHLLARRKQFDSEIITMLIDNGVDVNAVNELGHTALARLKSSWHEQADSVVAAFGGEESDDD